MTAQCPVGKHWTEHTWHIPELLRGMEYLQTWVGKKAGGVGERQIRKGLIWHIDLNIWFVFRTSSGSPFPTLNTAFCASWSRPQSNFTIHSQLLVLCHTQLHLAPQRFQTTRHSAKFKFFPWQQYTPLYLCLWKSLLRISSIIFNIATTNKYQLSMALTSKNVVGENVSWVQS